MVLLIVPLVDLPCFLIFLLWVFTRGQGGGSNEKTTLCKAWFFRGLPIRASMSPIWGHGRKQKRKNHVLESVVFSWFAHTGLYATPVRGKGGGKNEKNTLCKTCFFRGLPIRASMSPLLGALEEAKTKKTRFRKCGFFVVCPYGPLCHPCRGQGSIYSRQFYTKKTFTSEIFLN